MELKMDIGLDQLIHAIKKLPAEQFNKLKTEINKTTTEKSSSQGFKAFLLEAPVFSDDQLSAIEETRKSINKWREI